MPYLPANAKQQVKAVEKENADLIQLFLSFINDSHNSMTMNKGKKLDKKALKTIMGGSYSCIDYKTGRCMITGTGCTERECWYVPEPPFD
ncbi:hypothetical protein [Chryseobacterium sp. G0162]|uniref:hypothetical protein n=1 Tax=Chryseobacterium sp. G0162 TaxID=2487063 RepID=UPI001629CB21|nr:hypothetical protein [Chryseobacterium sp. G0162]